MSSHEYKKVLARKLDRLNKAIDYKILNGMSYADDSRQHKTLLRELQKQSSRGLFQKLATFVLF